jgi:hypothetical protein
VVVPQEVEIVISLETLKDAQQTRTLRIQMNVTMMTIMKKKIERYKVKESRYQLGENLSESITEVFIEELGWCRYSWETTGILVNSKWLFDWESLEPDSV